VREYLQAHAVEFDDRNIRQSEAARDELRAHSVDLIVPMLTFGGRAVVGFEPELIDGIIADYRETRPA
jgi:arsenate reductase-like glutaredoxin family protein